MQLDSWTQSLVGAMSTLWQKIAAFIPNLIGALVVVDSDDRPIGALNMHDLLRAGVM